MKLDAISLKLRLASTSFGNKIGGAASLAVATDETLLKRVPCAWIYEAGVVPAPDDHDGAVLQKIEESFAVVIAIKNTTDEPGANAFNTIDDLRGEIFGAILGWEIPGYDEPIEFTGGGLVGSTKALMFYQFFFKAGKWIQDEDLALGPYDDFLRLYGISEHIENGDFDTDSVWDKGVGWSIGSGVASSDGSQVAVSDLSQEISALVESIPFKVKFTITAYSAGTVTPILGGQAGTARSSQDHFEETIIAGGDDLDFILRASADFVGSVDIVRLGANYGIDLAGDGQIDGEFSVDLPGP